MKRFWCIALLGLVFLTSAARAEVDFPPSVTMRVLDAPRVATVDGKTVLCYEILLTNIQDQPCQLEELICSSGESQVARFDEATLAGDLRRLEVGARQDGVIAPGGSSLLFVWVELAKGEVPLSLTHRLKLRVGEREAILQGAPTSVSPGSRQTVGLPFSRPGDWVAGSGPSNTSDHRRALAVLDGEMTISQRYAFDWVLMDEKGNLAVGDGSRNDQHYCYGAEALAVADGEIAAVRDGVPQNVPGDSRAVVITPQTIGGNWVALRLGEADSIDYAMYAHLQPGSLRVKPGDKVKKGQVLGLIGNSGNSTAPHLHFHIASKPDWLRADGFPYLLEEYESMGTIVIPAKETDPLPIIPAPITKHRNDLPKENEILRVRE